MANRGAPRPLEAGKYDVHLQEKRQEDPENYRPASLTSELGNVMEQVILSATTQHIQDNQGIKPSQHWFMNSRSCLTNLISFYDKVTAYCVRERMCLPRLY